MATSTTSTDGDPARARSRAPAESDAPVRTFLIADVRGYTRFTQEHGDEAAGQLAASFAALAREAVQSSGGEVIELRGDEALCVFGSARQALRAAIELQTRFRRRTDDGPAFPLPIGIGLDAGEAVPIEGGYRGGALNTASRLCALAAPGQILATDTVVSLARQLEGIRFVDRRPIRLKGLEKPVRVIEVVPEEQLPPPPVPPGQRPARITRRRMALAAVAALALAAVTVGLLVNRALGPEFLSRLDANSVGVIDASAAGITSQLEVGSAPSALAGGGGFMWAASEADGTVSRIDPVTRAVRTLSLDSDPAGVAYGGGSLWVTMPDERAVAQINPRTLKKVQTFPVGNAPGSVAADESGVWVANTLDGTVSRISLDGVVMKPIPVGVRPAGIAVGAGAVWVTDEVNGNVLRIDSGSGKVVAATNVGNGPTSVVTNGRQVWVANRQDGTVSQIDPATNRVSATIPVGERPVSLAAGSSSVWVASEGDGTIARIDAGTNQREASLSVGSSPRSLALSGDELWVATFPSLASHRGGVLRVETDTSACDCTDPAFKTDQVTVIDENVVGLAYDGLVAYRHVGGIAGAALVGDLATDVPAPTDQGRTYTFQLRPGLRYSDGTPVRASDFRSSLERVLTVNRESALNLFGGIVGAATCKASPPDRCDLSSGIGVDDDEAGTITIRLTEADPDFVHKLANSLAFVVPAGSPLRASRTSPVPGTGPYQVASYRPGRAIRLVRNRYFRVWSQDASPDGYPDEIRFHPSEDYEANLAAVKRGQADWTQVAASELPAGSVQGLLTRYVGRLHSDPLPLTFWTFLNTRVPPFDDVRVRRALNYALDRTVLERGAGSALLQPIACQIVPPGLPGYRPYCPYTLDPNPAGTWTAPDLAKARALVAASGTRGMRVEAVTLRSAGGAGTRERALRYQVSLLRMLGYRSSLRLFTDFPSYLDYTADSRNRAQLGSINWIDYTPSSFLHLFSCAAFRPASRDNSNLSAFCDRGIDARMRRAAALQASDPARANALWAAVDRALVDRAPLVPMFSGRQLVLVSERVGNYQSHPLHGTLLDQLWVK